MREAYFVVAQSNAADSRQHAALGHMTTLARYCDELESSFARRIKESKARRGEAPAQPSKATRQQVADLAADRAQIVADVARRFSTRSPQFIVRTVHDALAKAHSRRAGTRMHLHPDDAVIYDETTEAMGRLLTAMADFLSEFPDKSA